MPTTAQITAAADTLTAAAKAQALALIRASDRYRANTAAYEQLEDTIAAADDTIKGQQLNAALTLIDEIGDGTVALVGGEDAVDYSQERDLAQLVHYMLMVLYEPAPRTVLQSVSIVTRPQF